MYDDDEKTRTSEEALGDTDADTREAIVAADDTGMVSGHVTLVEATIGDAETGSAAE